jgi:predicted AlkP superfamily phosphohydrolase/phosphomutase
MHIHMPKKRVALIGLDAAIPTLVKKYLDMGQLQTMNRLANSGTWAEGIPVFPTHTASNWNTIATGAFPKTHGVTDMVVHLPGTLLTEIRSGFYSNLCQAEQIWRTCERFSKRSILVKYIGSWPPNIEKGIQVEGFGAPGGPGSRPWGSSPLAIWNSSCYSTMPLENAKKINFNEARLDDWKNLNTEWSTSGLPRETNIKIGPHDELSFDVLILKDPNDTNKYNKTLFAKDKDAKSGFFLSKGQYSDWLIEQFNVNGKPIKGSFRMKLIDAEGDNNNNNENFRLFVSQIFPLEGWAFPNSICMNLINRFGPFLESISHFPYVFGWIDEDTYLEDASYQAKWLANSTEYLMYEYDWDLYMTQWHGIDNTQHAFLRFDKSKLTESEAKLCDRVVLSSYQIADDLVAKVVKATEEIGKRYTDNVYTFVVSDHGHVMGKRRFFINGYLYQKGMIKLKRDLKTQKIVIDWNKTQAFAQGMVHIYVNLKGRDPDGAVEPGKEYEDVVDRLKDILYDVKDPRTGLRPISLALSNNDAEFLGLSGERAGDVIFAANSVYVIDNRVKVSEELFEDVKVGFPDGSIHGAQLPSVDLGEFGTIKSMFIANGPNIKKGYVRKKPVNAVDVAPTISHILGIPPPKNSEGAVMYDIFE